MLVQALALAHLDYECLVYNDISAYLVQRLANAGLRFIFNLRRNTSTTPYKIQLGWTTIETRRLSFLGYKAYYKVLTKRRPFTLFQSLEPMFTLVRRSQSLNTPRIEVLANRISASKNLFFISASTLLSLLTTRIFACPTLAAFRTILREFLAERENTSNNNN